MQSVTKMLNTLSKGFKGCRYRSDNALGLATIREGRNEIFTEEKEKQKRIFSRIEKIQVEHTGPPEECVLQMNKNISTPFNVAMHISELLVKRSVIALVNGQPWDMHRPLEEDCNLSFQHFKDENPKFSNKAYWKTCSFILGYVLETAFKENYHVNLCSFPPPVVETGSFVYDADLGIPNWTPSKVELNCLSRIGSRLSYEDLKFERLNVTEKVANEIFKHNRFKLSQIPHIAAQSKNNTITVYRMGDHVDISSGPLISSTSQLGQFGVTAFHEIESPEWGKLTRVQGMSLPKQLRIHYWTYELLCQRAANLNSLPSPRIFSNQSQVEMRS